MSKRTTGRAPRGTSADKTGSRRSAGSRTTRSSPRSSRATKAEPTFLGGWAANTNWPELAKDLTGLVLLVLGVVVLFSLFSFDPSDPSFLRAGSNVQYHNWIGPVGANISSQLYSAFGWLAWLLPLVLLSFGWFLLRPPQLQVPVLKMVGWLMVLFAIAGLLALSDLDRPHNGVYHRGGWLGQMVIGEGLVGSLNVIGALILLLAVLVAGIVISTRFSLSWLPKMFDELTPGVGGSLISTVRRRPSVTEDEDEDEIQIAGTSRRAGRPPAKTAAAGRAGLPEAEKPQPALALPEIAGSDKRRTKPATPVEEEQPEDWFAFENDAETGESALVLNRATRDEARKRIRPNAADELSEAETANGNGLRRIPTSLRGNQRPLPMKKGARPEINNDDWAEDADEEMNDDSAPPPPTPPPSRTVDEMLASATVKRIDNADPAPAEESKLSKVAKNVARLMANFKLPESEMLTVAAARPEVADAELMDRARQLAEKCAEFNVSGKVTRISPGPVVTTFEFKPDPGVKYSRITGLVDDLCLGLKAESVRIDRIPGKSTVGIEVPNTTRETIRLREVIESKEFRDSSSKLSLALGKTIYGSNYVADLKKMPHLLIAGATGAGKSVALNSILISMLYKASPDEVKFILVDPKRLELGLYADLPHLLTPIVTDPKRASYSLKWAVSEMENRYKHLAAFGVRNIDQYNTDVCAGFDPKRDAEKDDVPKPLPYIVVIIDELADLMMVSARDVEESITRLAQMARAVGIHLILATQRPSVDVITGLIKANFPSRISFRVSSKVDSRTIIDTNGAEGLLGQGDMLFLPPGTSRLVRVHGAYVDEKEVKRVCDFIRAQGQPAYDERVTMSEKEMEGSEMGELRRDEKYYEAVKIVVEMGRASTSVLQRRLRIGYGRAASIIDMMEHEGIIGPEEGASKPRQVLVKADFLERIAQLREEEY